MRALCLFAVPFLLAAETTIPVPVNLKPENIPPISEALMEKLDRYNESRSALLLDWDPVRREILISTRFGDVPQIHRVAMPGGARTQLTFYTDRVSGAQYSPTNDNAFVFAKDAGGGEFYQLYRYDTGTGGVTLLTDGKSRNTGVVWSHDGKQIAYSSTKRNGHDTDIYTMAPNDPQSAKLAMQVEGGGWAVADWSADAQKLLVSEHRSVNDTSLYLVDISTGRRELLTASTKKTSYGNAKFAPNGKGVWLTTDQGSEFHHLGFLIMPGRDMMPWGPEIPHDIEDLAVSRDGDHIAFVANEDGYSALHAVDVRTKKEFSLPAMLRGTILGMKWNASGSEIGFTLSSAKSPADVYSVDVASGKLERWTTSETGGLNPAQFSDANSIRWKSFDGREISGFLYRPPASFSGKRPVIVNIHGGPEGQSRPGFQGRNNYFLNELGVAVIYPNVRGSEGYGKTFLDLDNGLKREDSVKDIGALLDWIATQKDLDASRVMVTGGSYGGYMTLASMVQYNDRFKCAVDVVGISNFISFFERTQAYRRDLRRVEYGDERDPQIHAFFEKISPLSHANAISKPMMIVAGRNDPRVPWQEGQQMAESIRKNGAPVWYLVAEDEGHGFARKKNQDYQFAATAMFVQEYLLK